MDIHAVFKKKGIKEEIIVLLAGWCGMRRSEVFALKPDDIYKSRKIIRVDEGKVINDEGEYNDKPPKSDNGFREIATPNYLMNLIQEYMKSLGEIPDRLFTWRPDYWSEKFHNIIAKNNLPPIRFHDLRHYHASWLYKNGILDHKAADRNGDDIRTLKQVYKHIGVEDSDEFDEDIRQKLEKTMNLEPKKVKGYKIKRTMQKSMV
jgi:integrase